MKVDQYLHNNTACQGLFVSTDGRWTDKPSRGFEYKTRAELLGEKTDATPAEVVTKKKKKKDE